MKEWISENIVNIVIPLLCVFITWWLTVRHERKNNRAKETHALKSEINTLKHKLDLYEAVERFADSDCYVTKATGEIICPTCWGAEHKPIPTHDDGTGHYTCSHCNSKGVYSRKALNAYKEKQAKDFAELSNSINAFNRSQRKSHW